MTRSLHMNSELARALKPYSHAENLQAGILYAFGVRPGEAFNEVEYPILGFYILPGEEVFSLYALTPGRFIIFEMAKNGNSLTVATPISRIRRVVEEQIAENEKENTSEKLVLTIELDADKRVVLTQGESLEFPLGNEDNQPQNRSLGRYTSQSIETFTVYRLESKEDTLEQLADFAIAMRNALGT